MAVFAVCKLPLVIKIVRPMSIFIAFLFFSFGCFAASDKVNSAPKIIPDQVDVTVLSGANYSFVCQADRPVTWKFDQNSCTGHKISTELKNGLHESTLELLNINYTCVKYYYCVPLENVDEYDTCTKKRNSESRLGGLAKKNLLSRIYLFVDDPKHPIANADEVYKANFTCEYMGCVSVPCKPTSPNVKVELTFNKDYPGPEPIERRRLNIYEGFKVCIDYTSSEGEYQCTAEEVSVNYYLKIVQEEYDLIATISSNAETYVEGDELELICTVKHDSIREINLQWNLFQYPIMDRWIVDEQVVEYLGHQQSSTTRRLIIKNLKKLEDAVVHSCIASDDLRKETSAEFNLKILEPSIQFVELSGNYSLVLQIDEAAKWMVDIQSFPPGPIFNAWWTDNHGVRIPWSYQEDHEKVATLFDNKTTTLTISYPRIADLGNYTLFVDNGRVQKQQTFQLLIKDTPESSMSGVTVKPGEKAVVTCNVFGYPASNISWSYVYGNYTIGWPSRDRAPISSNNFTVTQITAVNQTSTLTFLPEVSGVVHCVAENSEGSVDTEADVVVSDMDKDFSISTDNKYLISAGDSVTLTCSTPQLAGGPGELSWFDEKKFFEYNEEVNVTVHSTPYSLHKTLHWDSVPTSATGKYFCKLYLGQNMVNERTWFMQVMEPAVKPASRSTDELETGDNNAAELDFLKSLLPEIRSMSASQRRRFKINIFGLIEDVLNDKSDKTALRLN